MGPATDLSNEPGPASSVTHPIVVRRLIVGNPKIAEERGMITFFAT